jgi:hypothetical protein
MDPNQMLDHLKDVPRQIVQIASDDPHVLDNCDRFDVALVGPR